MASPVSRMDSCWEDDHDLCDIRSDASLLRMVMDGGMRPADMLAPGMLPTWVHWSLGALISVTGMHQFIATENSYETQTPIPGTASRVDVL